MDIERQIKDLGKGIAYAITRKREAEPSMIAFEEIDDTNLFEVLLIQYLFERNINEADNLIFEQLDKHNTKEFQAIAFDFYEQLLQLSDEELLAANFSREEVYQSLNDLKKYVY
ncbi:MAG TPA: hypothetical protein DCY20_08050 [Firmicutes bacterium]|nr:hypothetical protein [Bacillota bacterium]